MRTLFLLSMMMLATTGSAASSGQNSGTVLRCDDRESESLKNAPAGVKRTDVHTLQITWLHGTSMFKDEPSDYELDGVEWEYCDYDPRLRLYFLKKRDEGLFTGVLLNEVTGKVLEAGEHVVISPDGARFFASQQPDGMDGKRWFIFKMDGTIEWQGDSDMDRRYDPSWTSQGQLQAKYNCTLGGVPRDAPWKRVSLKKTDGKWNWSPPIKCRN
jgi:hypothetical protein